MNVAGRKDFDKIYIHVLIGLSGPRIVGPRTIGPSVSFWPSECRTLGIMGGHPPVSLSKPETVYDLFSHSSGMLLPDAAKHSDIDEIFNVVEPPRWSSDWPENSELDKQ